MKAQELTPQPTEPPTKFVKINVQGTYFPFRQLGLDPDAQPATRFNLSELTPAVQTGTRLGISRIGGYSDGLFNDDSRRGPMAVFINAAGSPIAPGPESNVDSILPFPFCSPPPHTGPLQDYPHDFTFASYLDLDDVGPEYEVQVPEGAVALLLAPFDCGVSDNFDQNGDYGANIRVKLLKRDFYLGELTFPNANISEVDNLPTVQVDTLTEVKVPVFVSGLFAAENLNRQVSVTVRFGSQSQTQQIYLGYLVANNNSLNLFYNIKFKPEDVGIQTIVATINSDKSFGETNFENNQVIQKVRVGYKKYKIGKEVVYRNESIRSLNQIFMQVEPSTASKPLNRFGKEICSGKRQYEVATVRLRCFSTTNGLIYEPEENCTIQMYPEISKEEGSTGPHQSNHDQTKRPTGFIFQSSDPEKNSVKGKKILVPKQGIAFNYVTSEFSGDYQLSFYGIDPSGNYFDVQPIIFQTKMPNLVPISSVSAFLEIGNITSHSGDGDYVTSQMASALSKVFNNYYNTLVNVPDIPQSEIKPIRSEGASLYWGGRFDIEGTWQFEYDGSGNLKLNSYGQIKSSGHQCHREGEELDIGMSNFTGVFGARKKNILIRELVNDNQLFEFPVSYESPSPRPGDPNVTHWHIRLKK